MTDLLRSDFKRVFKDRLFLIMLIIGGVFALFNPLMFKGLEFAIETMPDSLPIGDVIDTKTLFFNAFSPGNNFGFVVPVLIAIVLCKDFSFGTVRNKIISGKTRAEIFVSMFLTCTAFVCMVMVGYAVLTMGISLIFYKYQDGGVTSSDIAYAFESVLFEILLYFFIAALICFLCASMKNVGLVIVVYVAVIMAFTLIASAFMLLPENSNEVFLAIRNMNPLYGSLVIGMGKSYTSSQIAWLVAAPLIYAAALTVSGWLIFRKKDLR